MQLAAATVEHSAPWRRAVRRTRRAFSAGATGSTLTVVNDYWRRTGVPVLRWSVTE
jgi:hypothetical protein